MITLHIHCKIFGIKHQDNNTTKIMKDIKIEQKLNPKWENISFQITNHSIYYSF